MLYIYILLYNLEKPLRTSWVMWVSCVPIGWTAAMSPRLLGRWPASAPIWQAWMVACSIWWPFGCVNGLPGYPKIQKSNGLPSCFPVELPFSDIHYFQTNPFGLLIGPCEVSCLLMDKSELEKPETKACMARKGLMHGNRATGHLRLSERFEECYRTLLSCTTYNCANPKLYLPSPVATDERFP